MRLKRLRCLKVSLKRADCKALKKASRQDFGSLVGDLEAMWLLLLMTSYFKVSFFWWTLRICNSCCVERNLLKFVIALSVRQIEVNLRHLSWLEPPTRLPVRASASSAFRRAEIERYWRELAVLRQSASATEFPIKPFDPFLPSPKRPLDF